MIAARPAALVSTVLGGIHLGVDAHRVRHIEDPGSDEDNGDKVVDLSALLGLPKPALSETRRVLRIAVGDRVHPFLVGEQVKVEALPPDALHQVPSFVETVAARACIGWVFATGDRLGYVLDVDAFGPSQIEEHLR